MAIGGFNELYIAKLEDSFEETKEFVSNRFQANLKVKINHFIDDLGRASSEIVYEVLLMIKEIIDVRGLCVRLCLCHQCIVYEIVDNSTISYTIFLFFTARRNLRVIKLIK